MSEDSALRKKLRRRQRRLAALLRLAGLVDATALCAVLMPGSMLAMVHDFIGLGPFPDDRIVGYLARSTSLLYAMFGTLMLYLSFHVAEYRPLIQFFAGLFATCGLFFLGIDIVESMPLWWIAGEGPVVVAVGASLLWLARQCAAAEREIAVAEKSQAVSATRKHF
ncbi:MAG: hypothetical protein VB858_02395 [Planctomycetaceae bacterium]